MLKRIPLLLFIAFVQSVSGQQITQTIRGTVKDADTKSALIGASVAVYKDSVLIGGSSADEKGLFRIEKIAVGRYTIVAAYLGYQTATMPNIIVNSGKENILNIELEEAALKMEEISVTATRRGEAMNEMTTVSARNFSVEESDRYAGSRGDPARMASNFAGVQGADDSRNDIIVRGNSPFGVLYRLENVNIPNPNHFAVAGTTGGPVGILNNKVLGNSDFLTGAFPAEYGNSVAGVFDLKMRNGNDEKYEFTGQLGFFGTELTAEGPISKKKRSAFLVNYRYATISLFSALGIDLGTDAKPYYQDMSFKLNFPTARGGSFSVFGIGGKSRIDILTSPDKQAGKRELYGDSDKDEYFRSGMGVVGANYMIPIDEKSYLKATLAASAEYTRNFRELVYRHTETADSLYVVDSLVPELGYNFVYGKYSANLIYNRKINAQHSFRAGFFADRYDFNLKDSILIRTDFSFLHRLRFRGDAYLMQPYAQWSYKITDKWVLNAGMHGQYFNTSKAWSAEPRAGLRWRFRPSQSLNLGYGMHSQLVPTYVYYSENSMSGKQENRNLGFMRSAHYVLGYDNAISSFLRIKLETYYQRMSNIPIDTMPSSYSILNEGSGFDRFFPRHLVNKGTAQNYGVEMTLEKFYHRNYFFMVSATLYNSTYTPSDGKTYISDYNGNYVVNVLGTKEFKWGTKRVKTFGIGGKVTSAGGRRFTPVDVAASAAAGQAVLVDSLRNTQQFKNYFRADIKVNYIVNAKKLKHELGIDFVNILGTKNILRQAYVGGANPLRVDYQLGFLPVFYYRVDF